MSFNSGPSVPPPEHVGGAWISTDAYDEPVYVAEADVRLDNAEVDRERAEISANETGP